ncbi:MAG: serine hydrolase domain-containing protein [Candidatus Dormibacteria bacterium]
MSVAHASVDAHRATIQALLDESAARHGVVGASLAILDGVDIHEFATEMTSIQTAAPVTPRTRFLAGSTIKAYTAVLVMGLAEEGLLGLDDPITHHLPDISLRNWPGATAPTVGQLLGHTSGNRQRSIPMVRARPRCRDEIRRGDVRGTCSARSN